MCLVLFPSPRTRCVCWRTQFDCHIFLSLAAITTTVVRVSACRSADFRVQIYSIAAFVHIVEILFTQERFRRPAPALCPLICVRSCFVYLSIYLSVCLPVSTSLCVCLAFCLSVCTSGCLPLSVSPPSVAWASVALLEMNALFPPGFRCGVPPG